MPLAMHVFLYCLELPCYYNPCSQQAAKKCHQLKVLDLALAQHLALAQQGQEEQGQLGRGVLLEV